MAILTAFIGLYLLHPFYYLFSASIYILAVPAYSRFHLNSYQPYAKITLSFLVAFVIVISTSSHWGDYFDTNVSTNQWNLFFLMLYGLPASIALWLGTLTDTQKKLLKSKSLNQDQPSTSPQSTGSTQYKPVNLIKKDVDGYDARLPLLITWLVIATGYLYLLAPLYAYVWLWLFPLIAVLYRGLQICARYSQAYVEATAICALLYIMALVLPMHLEGRYIVNVEHLGSYLSLLHFYGAPAIFGLWVSTLYNQGKKKSQ